MKSLKILKGAEDFGFSAKQIIVSSHKLDKAIEELDAYITNYQGINRRLDNTVTTLAVLQNENKSLVKTLEKYNEEMIELRKENEDLKERSK